MQLLQHRFPPLLQQQVSIPTATCCSVPREVTHLESSELQQLQQADLTSCLAAGSLTRQLEKEKGAQRAEGRGEPQRKGRRGGPGTERCGCYSFGRLGKVNPAHGGRGEAALLPRCCWSHASAVAASPQRGRMRPLSAALAGTRCSGPRGCARGWRWCQVTFPLDFGLLLLLAACCGACPAPAPLLPPGGLAGTRCPAGCQALPASRHRLTFSLPQPVLLKQTSV